MLSIPSHDVKTVAPRCSGNQPVTRGNDLAGFLCGSGEFSPGVAGLEIDGKEAIRVMAFEGLQPCLEFAFVLAFLKKRNPLGDFSNGHDADKQTIAFQGFNRTANPSMSPRTAQFGKHAGIEKNSQNFTSRMGESSRVRFSPSRPGPFPIRNSLKSGRFPVSFS